MFTIHANMVKKAAKKLGYARLIHISLLVIYETVIVLNHCKVPKKTSANTIILRDILTMQKLANTSFHMQRLSQSFKDSSYNN